MLLSKSSNQKDIFEYGIVLRCHNLHLIKNFNETVNTTRSGYLNGPKLYTMSDRELSTSLITKYTDDSNRFLIKPLYRDCYRYITLPYYFLMMNCQIIFYRINDDDDELMTMIMSGCSCRTIVRFIILHAGEVAAESH